MKGPVVDLIGLGVERLRRLAVDEMKKSCSIACSTPMISSSNQAHFHSHSPASEMPIPSAIGSKPGPQVADSP